MVNCWLIVLFGAQVLVNYARSAEQAEQVAKEVKSGDRWRGRDIHRAAASTERNHKRVLPTI